MLKVKKIFEFVSMILLASIMLNVAGVKASTDVPTWKIETGDIQFDVLGKTIHLWEPENPLWCSRTILYRNFDPQTDFKISFEVKAVVLRSLRFVIGIPYYWSRNMPPPEIGFTFEAREHIGDVTFGVDASAFKVLDGFPVPTGWFFTGGIVASGQENVWYRMVMTVHRSRYRVVAKVFEERGGLLGERAIDMDHFLESILKNVNVNATAGEGIAFRDFNSIHSVCLEVSESDLYIRNFSIHNEHQSQWYIGEVIYHADDYPF